jgi:hypothetical protein
LLLLLEEGPHTIVQQIRREEGLLPVLELGKGHFRVRVEESLLLDPSDAFDRADILRILRSQLARMCRLDLAVCFLLLLGLLSCLSLGFRYNLARLLPELGFEHLEPFGKGGQILPPPDAAHARGRDKQALFRQFVGHTQLSPSWLLEGPLDHRWFDGCLHAIGNTRLATADFAPG